MRRVRSFSLLALVVFAAASCVESSHADTQKQPGEGALKVETQPVGTRPVASTITLTGTLLANRRSLVASDGSGKVLATYVERGALVRAGDPLVRLDDRSASLSRAEASAQVRAARINSERARRDCDRAAELKAQEVINQAEFDRMTAECNSSAANASAAAARESMAGKLLTDAVVRAPFGGLVDERTINVGEYVRGGQAVATVIEIDPLRLELTVPETSVGNVQVGQTVEFEVSAYPDVVFTGTVRYLSAAMRRLSRDLIVEAVVQNPDHRLKPGMFAVARVTVGELELPVIPGTAVREGGERPRVFVAHDGRLEERLVQLGRRQGDGVAVLAGVKPGEKVVVKNAPELRDGLRVE